MTSVFPLSSPRKHSKNDLKLIEEEQEKITQMVHSFYEKTKTKIGKSLGKCESKNTLLCRELFQSLSLHPNQELYETIRLHDLLFNEIDLIGQAVTDFLRRVETIQERLRAELALQHERNSVKREKVSTGENSIAVLRKVSFKREKHALKHRLVGLDTINKKILKCEDHGQQINQLNGFHLDIEGKKTDPFILTYSKIWFESKRREYLLCLGIQQAKTQFYIFNDKLQTIAIFSHPCAALGPQLKFLQLGDFLYFIAPHQVTRISLLNEEQMISKSFPQKIIGAQVHKGAVVLWVVNQERQHAVLFADEQLKIYCQIDFKLSVSSVPAHFRLNHSLYCLTRTQTGLTELLRIAEDKSTVVSEIGTVEEVIPVCNGKETESVIFRLAGNKFLHLNQRNGLSDLDVEIEQGEIIRSCIVLGEHFYALSENGKSMLQCHYNPKKA